MPELSRELYQLKEEIGLAREQTLRTEEQFSELAEAFRSFNSRFAQLERRGRAARIGTQVLVALAVAIGTYVVTSGEIDIANQRLAQAQSEIAAERDELREHERTLEAEAKLRNDRLVAHQQARQVASALIQQLDAENEEGVLDLLPKLDLDNLDPLARELVAKRASEFRARMSEQAYRWGRELLARSRRTDAIASFARSVKIWPDGPRSNTARILQAHALREARRFSEAADVFTDLQKTAKEKATLEESLYWEAYCRSRAGQLDKARQLYEKVVATGGKHSGTARTQLAGLAPDAAPSQSNTAQP